MMIHARWHIYKILISLANDLIYVNDFNRVPLFFLRIPKNSKFKFYCPSFATRPKLLAHPFMKRQIIICPPLNSKIKSVYMIP